MAVTASDFRLAGRLVRPSSGEIECDEGIERLEPRSMQVLLALCDHAGEVVNKSDLIGEVWGETFVSDEALTHAIWDVRRALGDKASQPQVIQTIPKRGYRLIAAVEQELGVEEEEPRIGTRVFGPKTGLRIAVVTTIGIGAIVSIAALIGLRTSQPTQVESTKEEVVSADSLLLILPSEGPDEIAAVVDEGLAHSLDGTRDLQVRRSSTCDADGDGWCLEVSVRDVAGGFELRPTVEKSETGDALWRFPVLRIEGETVPDRVLEELRALIRAAFAVKRMKFFSERDVRPWISQEYDPRAVHAFLEGVGYVYLHEVGSVDLMEQAMALDPSFIAPLVWRAPSVAAKGDPEEIERYRIPLEGLAETGDGTAFENAMIRWAIAMLDNDTPLKLRHLRVALDYEPTNRPALLARAAVEFEMGRIEDAWSTMRPLVEERWSFPAVYSMAAACAMMLGKLDDAKSSLELGTDLESVDPTVYGLLVALAVYDADPVAEARYQQLLADRLRELLPEEPELVTKSARQLLAGKAEAEGRASVAERLRAECHPLAV